MSEFTEVNLMTDPTTNLLAPSSPSFLHLPPIVQQHLLHARDSKIYAREPVPPGTAMTQLLEKNLHEYILPDNSSLRKK